MKLISLFFLILFLFIPIPPCFAENSVKSLDELVIELWPDYDRTSVLVLLTGSLPANTKLPATVTLPFPEAAQFNAVARIDSSDGQMKDDILSSPAPGEISLITPNLRFRLEYYLPYTVNNLRRSFDFSRLADIAVDKFQLNIQQPLSAISLDTEPAATDVVKTGDGFVYHTFPARTVKAGLPFLLHVEYKMTNDQLSVESRPSQNIDEQTPGLPAGASAGSGISWAIVAAVIGGLMIIGALAWQVASARPSPGIRKPTDTLVEKESRNKFCQYCGKPVDNGGNFCGECGMAL